MIIFKRPLRMLRSLAESLGFRKMKLVQVIITYDTGKVVLVQMNEGSVLRFVDCLAPMKTVRSVSVRPYHPLYSKPWTNRG